jgi:AMP deaminase
MSETDDHGSVSTTRKGKSGRKGLDGTVNEAEEGSDGDLEEAGGMDE